MDPKLHAILGQLHSLLSIAQPDDLERASNLRSVSSFMREALRALARERNRESSKDGQPSGLFPRTEREKRPSRRPDVGAGLGDASRTEDQVLSLIMHSPQLSKKAGVEIS